MVPVGFFTSSKAQPVTLKSARKAKERGQQRRLKESKRTTKANNKSNKGGWFW